MTYLCNAFEPVPQSEPLDERQVQNSAGGYTYKITPWQQLERFLILGSEGNTYYASERKLTLDNAKAVRACIKEDPERVAKVVVEISKSGRAPKNDPALMVLALMVREGSLATKRAAYYALPHVARIGTHLLHFVSYVDGGQGGWGRSLRRAVAEWYTSKPAKEVAFQAMKYQSRDEWTQKALLKLAHPKPPTESHREVFYWMRKGWDGVGELPHPNPDLVGIWAFERAKRATSAKEIVLLIRDYGLQREEIPTQFLKDKDVWAALLEHMPMTAMVRNLANMTRIGLLAPMSAGSAKVVAGLEDQYRIRGSRVHPIQMLAAQLTYSSGRNAFASRPNVRAHRGRHQTNDVEERTWSPVQSIVDALDKAFYLSFGNVQPTGKRLVLALDVSGSMASGEIAGVPGLTPRAASAALALVTANVEKDYVIVGFTAGSSGRFDRNSASITPLDISPRQRLTDVVKYISNFNFGGTDCALPMLWAMQNDVKADGFAILTDNETWTGKVHPAEALKQYRRKTGIPAKLVVVAMTSTGFSIADPDDAGMLDCCGFDTATPNLISDFIREG